MYALAHACFGAAVVSLIGTTPVYGAIGGIMPDIDTLLGEVLPLSHRGLLHTPLMAVGVAVVLYLLTNDRMDSLALGTGYLTHLFLDTFTPAGIMWLFPWKVYMAHDMALASSVDVNLAIASIGLIGLQYTRIESHLTRLDSPEVRTGILIIFMGVTAGATVVTGSLDPQGFDERPIEQILEEEPIGEKVAVTGTVDEIADPYEGGSSTYQRIYVKEQGHRILIFCSATNGEADIEEGQRVRAEGSVSEYNGDIQLETSCIDIEPT